MNEAAMIKVWDPAVRLFHWLLVAAFFIAYFTDDKDVRNIHVIAGYTVLGLVAFRVVWGFVGSRRARFSDFVGSPGRAFRYALDAVRGRAARYLGHNPAGGWMIVLLLLALLGTTVTGLAVYGADQHAGPMAGLFATATAEGGMAPARAAADRLGEEDEDATELQRDSEAGARAESKGEEKDGIEDTLEELHEFFANLTVFLVALHVLGVFVESRLHRENLVRAMFTGYKRA